ncbi:LAQU0S02e10066g1_1 [Lachancea quebecensis]|uniref:LAQU0S02e10066g1_1 n=1 Tax=Lachancea quebecensis TaxID=1654605 RepID=A0A0P1KR21_9SACH|nr:LAQU0S02e10066g1_1 [Lachancea quebecensis]
MSSEEAESAARKRVRERWSQVEYNSKAEERIDERAPKRARVDNNSEVIDLTSDQEDTTLWEASDTDASLPKEAAADVGASSCVARAREIAMKYPFKLVRSEYYDEGHDSDHFITLQGIFLNSNLVKTWLFSFQYELDFILPMFNEFTQITIVAQKGTILPLTRLSSKSSKLLSKMKTLELQMPPFACHHSKMIVNEYRDGSCRIYIPSNNFTHAETNLPQQIVWCSPHLQRCCEAPKVSGFRDSLVEYLSAYPVSLKALIEFLGTLDFTPLDQMGAEFIFSCPKPFDSVVSGIPLLHKALLDQQHASDRYPGSKTHRYLSQVSTIGAPLKTGLEAPGNLFSHLMVPLLSGLLAGPRDRKKPYEIPNLNRVFEDHHIKPYIMYPTPEEIQQSPVGYLAGGWFHFHWLRNQATKSVYNTLKRWGILHKQSPQGCPTRGRTPSHTKFYMKSTTLPDNKAPFSDVDWFLFTTANLSLNAWGTTTRKPQNYEVGVLLKSQEARRITVKSASDLVYSKYRSAGQVLGSSKAHTDESICTMVPFDIRPVPYQPRDDAFCISRSYEAADINGKLHQAQN